ncbi:hypothetical protein NIES4071_107200 (plasmid) [Calothrix sp. NIES-4071]|nr:hypothetical protein NIES4071_107200 [Calothrix sp. NIES-4071]BAZ64760.1 hypothetical protein NIES4105_104930 [Calothrix sp. NIES-4105]
MHQIISTIYNWKGFGDGFGKWDSKCQLSIYDTKNNTIVVVSDLGYGSGTSITNCAAQLCTLVVKDYNLNPEKLIWIEHYPKSSSRSFPESYDLVNFDVSILAPSRLTRNNVLTEVEYVFNNPRWQSLLSGDSITPDKNLKHLVDFCNLIN